LIKCLPPALQTASDYGPYIANEPSPLLTTTIVDKCTQKLVDDWNKMRCQVNAAPCMAPNVCSGSQAAAS